MVKLEPKIIEEYTCRQSVVTEIAKALSFDYQMIALGTWRFPYNSQEILLGKSIAQVAYDNFYDYVRKYNGINIREIDYIDEYKVKLLISKQPIIVQSDVYFCKWFLGYKKYNISHFFIVNRYSEQGYECIDPSMCSSYIYLNWMELRETIHKIFVLEKEERQIDVCLKKVIQEDMKCYLNTDIHNLFKFIEKIRQMPDFRLEAMSYGKDVFQVPIVDNIRQLYTYRLSYIEMMKYVSKCENIDWAEIIDKMILCVNEWKNIRNIIIKNFVRGKYLLEITPSFAGCLNNIICLESEIAYSLANE